MLLTVGLLAVFCCGCESARRHNRTSHTIERWELQTNSVGHIKRFLVYRERWIDANSLTFSALFTDPNVSGWTDVSTNQAALGGGQRITFGSAASKVDSEGIKATGAAAGDVIGNAIKAAVK